MDIDDTHRFAPGPLDLTALRGRLAQVSYIKIYAGMPPDLGNAISQIDINAEQLMLRGLLTPADPQKITEDELIAALTEACQVEMCQNTHRGGRPWTVRAMSTKGDRSITQRTVTCVSLMEEDVPRERPPMVDGSQAIPPQLLAAVNANELITHALGRAASTLDTHSSRAMAALERQIEGLMRQTETQAEEIANLRAERNQLQTQLMLAQAGIQDDPGRGRFDPELLREQGGQIVNTIKDALSSTLGPMQAFSRIPQSMRKMLMSNEFMAWLQRPGSEAELGDAFAMLGLKGDTNA